MCNKAILENGRTLESVPDRYKTQEMCDKAVDNYADAFALIAIRLKICVIKPSILILLQSFSNSFVPECHKTQEMCDRVIYEDPFMLIYCPIIYKTQNMCDEGVDDCLAALKFIPD